MFLNPDSANNLTEARKAFGRAFDESRHFLLTSYLAQIISSSIVLEMHPDNNSPLRDKIIERIPEIEEQINQMGLNLDILGGGEGYNNLLTEKAFLDSYRIFENFIAEIFVILGIDSPELFIAEKDYVKIDPQELFDRTTLSILRRHVIEREVQQLLFGHGIYRGLLALCKKIELNVMITIDQRNRLNLAAILRNLVMHHNSRMNTATARQSRKLGLDLAIQPNESIRDYLRKEYPLLRDDLGKLAVAVYQAVLNKFSPSNGIPQIEP